MTAHSPTRRPSRSVVFDATLLDDLVDAAREDGRSASAVVRDAVSAWLAARETSMEESRELATLLGRSLADVGPIITAQTLLETVEASQ